MHETPLLRRGRGSVSNVTGRFEAARHLDIDDGWSSYTEPESRVQTHWRDDCNRTIITRNQSPDIHFDRSVNPYRGCEHGCIYCFARPSHTYLGHSAGLDFETRLYAKRQAPELLRQELSKKGYRCEPIAIGVNTDAYQPLEKRLTITRQVLEVLVETNHPAYLITKSSLIERDIDLLTQLAERKLVSVCITITTLDRKLARNLEPRATTPSRRLQTLKTLSDAGIPTRVSVSPVIPALNEEEMDAIVEAAASAGAQAAYAIVLRLPHELQQLFPEWLELHYPLRAARVMKAIRSVRSDKLNNAEFGARMIGSGPRADIIRQRFELACKRAGISVGRDFQLDCSQFKPPLVNGSSGGGQLSLF
jgi:DNA repair photolyase